ncbi:hybrid sensor histidine kinase/response regulator [Agitococcus lubricus]|uniref:histidine kinase n=1 Tax=Agitococcus lubricus TaxID=1077255 RepID=A0A2T5J3C3_9GAMM|nr:hybrid sensor histidine kinase/response regulator [Agitococcus lubricus]PTQ91105.1 signal transduction histidine kinase [Agitococcus lubricus]
MPIAWFCRVWCVWCLLCSTSWADLVSSVDVAVEQQNLAKSLRYIEDKSQQLTWQQVATRQDWQAQTQEKPYFGYSTSAYWLKVNLHHHHPQAIDRLLEISYPLLDDIQLYLVQGQSELRQSYQLGDRFAFDQRPIRHRLFLVPLHVEPEKNYTLYIRVVSTSGLQVPLSLWESHRFQEYDHHRQLLLGVLYGAFLIMAAYNFFIWLSVREKSYLIYVAFVMVYTLLLTTVDGLTFQYLWPTLTIWNNKAIVIILALALFLSMLFSRYFLHTQRFNPRIDRLLIAYMLLMILIAGLACVMPYRQMIIITIVLSAGVALLLITTGILNWRAGNRAARFFVCAWLFLAAMVLLYDLSQLHLIPKTTLTNIALQIGELCEVLLLSFALADRINLSRQQEQQAQLLLMNEERRANAEREQHLQTKLKAQEEEIKAKQAIYQAQSESRAKSLFLATMSHEIRTPMNGVLGMTELLQNTELTPQQQQYLQVIHSSGSALLNIINDILDYSKIEAGKMDIELIDMDLDKLLLECASIFSLTAEQKQLEFLASIEPQTPLFIKSDPTRLRQVLLNLLSNAFKFTHRGCISLRVHAEENQQQAELCFEVSDTGIGMTEEQQTRLFTAFHQADASTTRQFGGTGLGLSISKRLIDLMQGHMTVQSQIGQGTLFSVRIPYQTASHDYINDHFVPLTALQNQRILFVDDSIDFTQIMTEQARAWGMIAEAVHDGEHALQLMRQATQRNEPYDIAALDMRMPRMTGLELAEKMAQDPTFSQTKRILLTAMRMPPSQDELAAVGLTLVIQKPTSANMLRDALLKLLGCQQHYRSQHDKRQDHDSIQQALAGKRLLIAEDNAVNQMVISGMLKKLAIHVDIAQDGLQAVQYYQQQPLAYDAILMDCEMPRLDGYGATVAIREFEQTQKLRTIPIVALTAHAMREQQLRCLKSGMDDFLTKPLAFERLKQLLMQLFWHNS